MKLWTSLRPSAKVLSTLLALSSSALAQYSITTPQGAQHALTRSTNGHEITPSIMYDGNRYRMSWCGSRPEAPGDHLLYAEAPNLNGPWTAPSSSVPNSYRIVFGPSRVPGAFDEGFTCGSIRGEDGGKYYLYYGGTAYSAPQQATTAIGVASSDDGLNWVRLNNSRPILSSHPTRYPYSASRPYGTGQASVVAIKTWLLP